MPCEFGKTNHPFSSRVVITMSMRNPAFELNEDGSAKDPAAFRAALLADEQRVKKLQVCPCAVFQLNRPAASPRVPGLL